MAQLNVEGAFLITIGHGSGPETIVVISVSDGEGRPVIVDLDQEVEAFVALSAMFGNFAIPLRIVDHQPMPLGYYGFRVEAPKDLGVDVYETVPATLGIVVEKGGDRGQTLACSCEGARVTSFFGRQVQEPPKG